MSLNLPSVLGYLQLLQHFLNVLQGKGYLLGLFIVQKLSILYRLIFTFVIEHILYSGQKLIFLFYLLLLECFCKPICNNH